MKIDWIRAGWVAAVLGVAAWAQTTELESRTLVVGNSYSEHPALSGDGTTVAFMSNASNLVAGDANGHPDVFVFDRSVWSPVRVSVSTTGGDANGLSDMPAISGDGRYVAFRSEATNLVANDTNGSRDGFVRDRLTGTTERISLATGGAQADDTTIDVAISSDGRYVALSSTATNLVAGDTNGQTDVFVRDRQLATTVRASVATGGAQGNSASYACAISGDGRTVAFQSDATTLVPGDTNAARDIFVRNLQAGTTVRASVSTGGTQGNADSYGPPSLSGDGRYVAFSSDASNLVAGDTNGSTDVFVRDLVNGTTERASVGTGGVQASGGGYGPSISGDGRFVAFQSGSTDLVPGDTNGHADVFVHDRLTGSTVRVSLAPDGSQENGDAGLLSISADGSVVAFESGASNLVPNDTNGTTDIFVHGYSGGATALMSGAPQYGNAASDAPVVSADGGLVAFQSVASNLVAGDGNAASDVFVADPSTATVERISVSTGGVEANGSSYVPTMTPDGRFVAFASNATNLAPGDTNNFFDVFLRDRQIGTTERVSVATNGAQANGQSGYYLAGIFSFSQGISITPDGRYVAFGSTAPSLDGASGFGDTFIRDRQTGTTENVSVPTGGGFANEDSYAPSISADGRYVVFLSFASNLVAGDTNGVADVFVHDRQAGTTQLVSVAVGGGVANGESAFPAISADGRYVVFVSEASNLVAGDANGVRDAFVRDLLTGTTELASVSSSGVQGNADSFFPPSISSDGRFVVFSSSASNLVVGDVNAAGDVFLRDRQTKTTTLVSVANAGAQGNSASGPNLLHQAIEASISPGGRYIAFASLASNFAANDANGASDVFLRDRGEASAFVPFCFGDGSGAACPCTNSGSAGHGCENSSSTGGAILTASGVASLSADTVALTASGEKPTATSVLLSGVSTVNSLHYGDGLRCVAGTLKRLYTHNAVGGVVTMPQGADASISARAAASGDVIAVGSTRNYQIYYRDPSATFCPTPTGSTFNISSAIAIAWGE